MKKIKWVVGLTALCVALFILFSVKTKNQEAEAPPESGNSSSIPSNPVPSSIPANAERQKPNARAETPHKSIVTSEPPLGVEEKSRAAVEAKNVPVDFWGEVVNQSGAPLSEVAVQWQIRHWDYVPDTGASARNIEDTATTGTDGQFHIGGSTGDDLTLKIQKEGYELEPLAKLGFGFGNADQPTSRPDAPIIFKMWPLGMRQKLITGQMSFHIIPDGRSYFVDLAKSTTSESGSGNLKLWIKIPEQIAPGEKHNWSCEIDVISGGILEETDTTSSMYSAPPDGYAPAFQFNQQAVGRQRASTGTRRFYLKMNNGQQYGKITVEMIAPYNDRVPGLVRLDYAINPSGSPILR